MNEVIEFLKENPVQYFATVGLDNKAKVRPFRFMIEDGGKLYFCTNNEKDVFKQIKNNPYVEVCVSNSKFQWMRLNGKVKFSNDMDIKKKVIESSPLVKSLYKTADNPIFEIFYLEDAKAIIADFSGNAPKEFNL
ncbi:MAG: pyridoxamine 5'-phosphate oxidase family protein [Sarcina ventriculi]|nr:pyridoxamine 5'-phosphate oxidase family protein [Sarcina ventriculi]MDY7061606.1 pyridoxamine 5'-phosphate oxidase family protein [Sarcina ventriculi]